MAITLILTQFEPPEIFPWVLPLLVNRHSSKLSPIQLKRKLMKQTRKMARNLILDLSLAYLA